MNDTSATVKIRWTETVVRTLEAEVPVDQIPDSLIIVDEDNWSIETGDVDSYEGNDFLEALDDAGSAEEVGLMVENRCIEDDVDVIPPVMVAAPPVPAAEVMIAEDDYVGDLAERAEWRAELREGSSL